MKKYFFILPFFLLLVGCNKKVNFNFQKINIGMNRGEIEKLIGKGDSLNSIFEDGDMKYYFSYINDTLTGITYEPIDENKKDSTVSIGMLDNFLFIRDRNNSGVLVGYSIGNISIKYADSVNFSKPICASVEHKISVANQKDILFNIHSNIIKHGMSNSHIFRVKGKIDSKRTAILVSKIDDLTCLNHGVKDSIDNTINMSKFNYSLKIINNEVCDFCQRKFVK